MTEFMLTSKWSKETLSGNMLGPVEKLVYLLVKYTNMVL